MTAEEIITKLIDENKITGEEAVTLITAMKNNRVEYVPTYIPTTLSDPVPNQPTYPTWPQVWCSTNTK